MPDRVAHRADPPLRPEYLYGTIIGMTKNASAPPSDAARLRAAIAALVRRFSLSERADVACCGLTVAQAATLEALAGGPRRAVDLGRRLGITVSTLSRNVERLVQRGLVERHPDPDDARAVQLALTAAGRRAAAEVRDGEEEFAATILARLPAAERRTTVGNLERLLGAIREATEDCCPGAFDHLMQDEGDRT